MSDLSAPESRSDPAADPDRALVGRFLANGDEGAFRELYRAHTPYLFGLAVRLSGGRQTDAEDAVQEAWLRAARALHGFRWGSRLRTWLGGFVVNCCREARRRAERDAPRPGAAETRPRDAGWFDLETALRRLPDGLREVIVLHVVEGYTHEEIGSALGIAPGTSKSRLFDARRALRASLGVAEEGGGR